MRADGMNLLSYTVATVLICVMENIIQSRHFVSLVTAMEQLEVWGVMPRGACLIRQPDPMA
jgi:hypothetical protein